MRRFRHSDSSAGDPEKKRSRFDEKAASRSDSSTRGDQRLTNCGSCEILPRASWQDRSNPYFPGTKCISAFCREPVRSQRESNLAGYRHQAGHSVRECARNREPSSQRDKRRCVTPQLSDSGAHLTHAATHPPQRGPSKPEGTRGRAACIHAGAPMAASVPQPRNLLLAARRHVGHIRLVGDVAEWLKAAVC